MAKEKTTRTQRREQRRLAAEEVRGGAGLADTARKYERSQYWLYRACEEFNVATPTTVESRTEYQERHPRR